jgi:hypothetical protein
MIRLFRSISFAFKVQFLIVYISEHFIHEVWILERYFVLTLSRTKSHRCSVVDTVGLRELTKQIRDLAAFNVSNVPLPAAESTISFEDAFPF